MVPRSHTVNCCQPCWNGTAAHREVGEVAQAEEGMIVIEYEMLITSNELTIQVGTGPENSAHLSARSTYCKSLKEKKNEKKEESFRLPVTTEVFTQIEQTEEYRTQNPYDDIK